MWHALIALGFAQTEWKHPIYAIDAEIGEVDFPAARAGLASRYTTRWTDAAGSEIPQDAWTDPVVLQALILIAANDAKKYGATYNLEYETRVDEVPVQIRLDVDANTLDVRVGAGPFAFAPGPAPADLASALNAESVTGPFTQLERDILWWAYQLLTPAERSTLAQAHYERLVDPPKRMTGATARHRNRPPVLTFSFTDGALTHAMWGPAMIGDLDRVHHLGQETIVHEFGHAVGYAVARMAAERRTSATGRERRKLGKCTRKGYWYGPVEAGFRQAAGDVLWSPSDYGMARIGEAFAEGFAFWKLHPTWLAEARPDVYAWFEQGGHVAWMDDPTWTDCGAP